MVVIGGSTGSGILISRIGRYKWIILGSMILLVIGAYLMTFLRVDTSNWALWGSMFVMGLGLGPSMPEEERRGPRREADMECRVSLSTGVGLNSSVFLQS